MRNLLLLLPFVLSALILHTRVGYTPRQYKPSSGLTSSPCKTSIDHQQFHRAMNAPHGASGSRFARSSYPTAISPPRGESVSPRTDPGLTRVSAGLRRACRRASDGRHGGDHARIQAGRVVLDAEEGETTNFFVFLKIHDGRYRGCGGCAEFEGSREKLNFNRTSGHKSRVAGEARRAF